MNSKIYGNTVIIPEKVLKYLESCFNAVPNGHDEIDGYKRNMDLRTAKSVSYQQLKRIKNWFDSYEGQKEDSPYILNGSDYFRNWVDSSLDQMRNGGASSQTQEYVPNANVNHDPGFMDVSSLNRPSQSHNKTIDKYDSAVTESLKKINEIMGSWI